MLLDASAINGYSIEASDGPLGTVGGFLFSNHSWRVNWLVVDPGIWLSGGGVLLNHYALRQPDPAPWKSPIEMTKRQVKGSPDISASRYRDRWRLSYAAIRSRSGRGRP